SALGEVDWNSRGTSRPLLGVFCILFGVLTIPSYVACAITMITMRELSAYKIMIYLAVADISSLIIGSIGFGVMSITGEVFCGHPRFQLLYSLAAEFFFFCSTTACFLLALNRLGEMISISPIVWLFKCTRIYVVLFVGTMAVGLLVLFTPLLLFNSDYHMLFFDPMIFEGRFVYDSYVHLACAILMPSTSLLLYFIMLLGLIYKHGSMAKWSKSDALSTATYQILVQSGVIIAVHLTSVMSFQVLQFLPVSALDTALYLAHFGWMMVHG
ncbi:hypothetical protein PMAYCL1PPCAC_16997, partial [Pristionchus mayeri]